MSSIYTGAIIGSLPNSFKKKHISSWEKHKKLENTHTHKRLTISIKNASICYIVI